MITTVEMILRVNPIGNLAPRPFLYNSFLILIDQIQLKCPTVRLGPALSHPVKCERRPQPKENLVGEIEFHCCASFSIEGEGREKVAASLAFGRNRHCDSRMQIEAFLICMLIFI